MAKYRRYEQGMDRKVDILFFISVHGHGRGGHANSLHHIANKISADHQVGIVAIGSGYSSIISENPNFLAHIDFSGINLLELKSKVAQIVKRFSPEIIHCFDVGCYNITRLFCSTKKYRIALNKCGGPNPEKFPYVKNLVLFSAENKQWFDRSKRYNDSHIALIPNRVSTIQTMPLDILKPEGHFSFVRIARIGRTYRKSIFDSIELISGLNEKNGSLKLRLFVIGVVECPDTLSEILKHKYVIDGTVTILTEDKYTNEASKMLYLADAVIGTGRGIMEAASLGLPSLTINSLSSTPTLITKKTFEDAFRTNFSERNEFEALGREENFSEIEKLVSNENFYRELSVYTKSMFEQHFDIGRAASTYSEFYKNVSTSEKTELLADSQLIFRAAFNFFKSSRKVKTVCKR